MATTHQPNKNNQGQNLNKNQAVSEKNPPLNQSRSGHNSGRQDANKSAHHQGHANPHSAQNPSQGKNQSNRPK